VIAWRVGRGWSESDLRVYLDRLPQLQRNYEGSHGAHLAQPEWDVHRSRSSLGGAPPGPPSQGGPFALGRSALHDYAFSDPAIVEAHFDPAVPLPDRRMLLELKPLALRYLCGVAVGAVRDEVTDATSTYGFRYDTLEGHVESGSEWFLLTKDHESGKLIFTIEASWRAGDFPNWWSRLGFTLVGKRYQRTWHERAHRRMAAFVRGWPTTAPISRRRLAHQGPEVVFSRDVPRWVPGAEAW
jgi:uncharacterized protein (UPF0548 family)